MRVAHLFKDKAYKVASDQASMSFFNKVTADYYRYALEGQQLLVEDKRAMEKSNDLDLEMTGSISDEDSKSKTVSKKGSTMKVPTPGGKTPAKDNVNEEDKADEGPNLEELTKEYDDLKAKCLKAYSYAQHKAEKNLMSAHPVRLGVALNFSVFKYEFMDDV